MGKTFGLRSSGLPARKLIYPKNKGLAKQKTKFLPDFNRFGVKFVSVLDAPDLLSPLKPLIPAICREKAFRPLPEDQWR